MQARPPEESFGALDRRTGMLFLLYSRVLLLGSLFVCLWLKPPAGFVPPPGPGWLRPEVPSSAFAKAPLPQEVPPLELASRVADQLRELQRESERAARRAEKTLNTCRLLVSEIRRWDRESFGGPSAWLLELGEILRLMEVEADAARGAAERARAVKMVGLRLYPQGHAHGLLAWARTEATQELREARRSERQVRDFAEELLEAYFLAASHVDLFGPERRFWQDPDQPRTPSQLARINPYWRAVGVRPETF